MLVIYARLVKMNTCIPVTWFITSLVCKSDFCSDGASEMTSTKQGVTGKLQHLSPKYSLYCSQTATVYVTGCWAGKIGSLRCGRFPHDGDMKTNLDWGLHRRFAIFLPSPSSRQRQFGDFAITVKMWVFILLFLSCTVHSLFFFFFSVFLLAQSIWGCAKQL